MLSVLMFVSGRDEKNSQRFGKQFLAIRFTQSSSKIAPTRPLTDTKWRRYLTEISPSGREGGAEQHFIN